MAKTKTLKKAVASSEDIVRDFKEDASITSYDFTEVGANRTKIINAIVQCIDLKQPNDVIMALETYLMATNKKRVPKKPDTPILAPATAKVVLAGIKAIIRILNPTKVVAKQPAKATVRAVIKKRRIPPPSTTNRHHTAIHTAGKKRLSKKRAV